MEKLGFYFDHFGMPESTGLTAALFSTCLIKKLEIELDTADSEAVDRFASFLESDNSSVNDLVFVNVGSDEASYFQERILQALYTNKSVRQLEWHELFCNTAPNIGTVGQLLAENSHLQVFKCSIYFPNMTTAWLRNAAEGLNANTTLKSFTIRTSEGLDLQSMCSVLASRGPGGTPSALEHVSIFSGDRLGETSIGGFSSVLRSQVYSLKKLELKLKLEDDQFLKALRMTKSSNLQSLSVDTYSRELGNQTWKEFGSILPKLSLTELKVNCANGNISESEQEAVINGLYQNRNLESVLLPQTFNKECW